MPDMSFTVICLGSGTSHGVPMIGCDCPVCTSPDPHDRRTRTSIVLDFGERAVLVDTSPELRLQCIANGIRRIDAVLYTHHHADHVTGMDDLRRFNWINRSEVLCYGMPATLEVLRRMFLYAFEDDPDYPSHKPQLRLIPIDGTAPLELFGRRILPIPLMHGPMPVLGFRVGAFAYCTDCNHIPEGSLRLLERLEVLILDGLRHKPHPTHYCLAEAVEVARRIGARQTFFTHIAHELKHAETNATLPSGMALAYDGLRFTIPLPRM
jgi:phosphoribosyl 1,2-cyclic phosphate phosphodiesterase